MHIFRRLVGTRDEGAEQRAFPTITPSGLRQLLDAGEDVVILDVRQPVALTEYPGAIPGSIRIPPSELPRRYGELPKGNIIVPY